jgi:uncharacterized protein
MRINLASLFPSLRSRMALKPPMAQVPAQICPDTGPREARSGPRESARSELPAGVERRFVGTTVELRAAKDGKGPGTLVGYAATFDQSSVDLGGFIESIAPGAFSNVLEDDCRCLRNHCDESLLGRTTAGTLRLSQDSVGLHYECDLPDTTVGRDTAELVRLKNITGCSFQFTIADGGQTWDFAGSYGDGMAKRTITKIGRLYDVGPVTFPAYESTKVDMRSFDAAKASRPPSPEQVRATLSRLKARQRFAEASVPPG